MIITRYLTREITQTLVIVTSILVLAFLSQQMVRYLSYVAVGKIPTNIFLKLVSFEIPYLIALLLPLGLYLGILLTFGRLYADHEMTILRMCGFGHRQFMHLSLWVTLGVSFLVLVLMLWVNPWISAKRQQVLISDEAALHLIQTLMPGRFQVSPNGRYVMYVEKISRDHERAENIFLAQQKSQNNQKSWMLVLAKEGYQLLDKPTQNQFFVTKEGYRYEGVPGQNDYKMIQFQKYQVQTPQPKVHNIHQENEGLSTSQLWNDYQNPKRAAEFQWRFSISISTLVLALLAVPLATVKFRQSRYFILLPAVLVYIIYINLLFIARHWVEQSIVPTSVGLWWVHGLMFFAVLIVSWCCRRRQRLA